MEFSILTYNLLLNRALPKLKGILAKHKPAIICLQEIDTSDTNLSTITSFGYTLAEYSNSFIKGNTIFGVATYYRTDILDCIDSSSIYLPFGLHEVIHFFLGKGHRQRTILKSFFHTKEGKPLIIYNVHLSPYTTNSLRTKQIVEIFTKLKQQPDTPEIVLGDFNYPYGRKKFDELIAQYSLQEATQNIFHTFVSHLRFFPFQFKLDYVLYAHLNHISTERLNYSFSDHYPLLSTFSLK